MTCNLNNNEYKEPSSLIISTCTVVSNINDELDVNLFSRLLPIYNINDEQLEKKEGGIFNITLFSDYSRGIFNNEKKNKIKEFNNQVTINYKYWGFRNVNIKIFTNGKLQMTGIKTNDEAVMVSNMIINYIKQMKIRIYKNKNYIIQTKNKIINNINNNKNETNDTNEANETNETNDTNEDNLPIKWVYNHHKNTINYYRKNNTILKKITEIYNHNYDDNYIFIDSEIKNLLLNVNKYLGIIQNNEKILSQIMNQLNKCIHNEEREKINFGDDFELNKIKLEDLIKNIDHNDTLILEKILLVLSNENNNVIINNTNLLLGIIIQYLNKQITNLNFDINKNTDYSKKQNFNNLYTNLLNNLDTIKKNIIKVGTKISKVRLEDINICNKLNEYILPKIKQEINDTIMDETIDNDIKTNNNSDNIASVDDNENDNIKSKNEELNDHNKYWEFCFNDINSVPKNYKVSNVKTELINSDYNTRFNINLKNLSDILKNKYNIYNSYTPDEYPGVLTKFYYNEQNEEQGQCKCSVHCSTKEKKSICCKITISIFRPGSIIITGAKNIKQLEYTYKFINTVLKDNFNNIKGIINEEENKNNIINNDIRKISRKPRLFYVKKENIVY